MKRYTRRKSYKVKILFSLLFLIILCMMAGKVLNSDFTLLPLDNITHHVGIIDMLEKKPLWKYILRECV